jgi:hypothetical protein
MRVRELMQRLIPMAVHKKLEQLDLTLGESTDQRYVAQSIAGDDRAFD